MKIGEEALQPRRNSARPAGQGAAGYDYSLHIVHISSIDAL
jgi:hypothetical protein